MKSIVECIHEALNEQTINESKSVLSMFVPYNKRKDNGEESIGSVERYYVQLKDLKPNDLKKIKDWKGFDKDKLEDYCTTIGAIVNYLSGLCENARGERDTNAYDMIPYSIETVSSGEGWVGYDSTLENLKYDEDLNTADDWDGIGEILQDVLSHMEEISKTFLKMGWA